MSRRNRPRVFESAPQVGVQNNRHGFEIKVRMVEVVCARCKEPFACQMSTKPKSYCPTCREIVRAEKTARDHARVQKNRAAIKDGTAPRRKIPFAGSR